MRDMPRPRPPHLQKRVTRHGKVVWYVRIGRGPLIRIPGEYGTDEFKAAYQAALNGDKPTKAKAGHAKDSIGWLVSLYMASAAWTKDMSKGTRDRRLPQLKQIIKTSGAYPVSSIDRQAVIAARDKRTAASQARTFVMTMRSMFAWAMENNLVAVNPMDGIKIKEKKTKGHIPWSEADLSKYERRWPVGTRERVMLDVYCYTGLRRGDAARVGKQHVKNGAICMVTEKSPTEVAIPILQPLAKTLAAGPVGDLAFNVNRFGKPFTSRGLGKAFHAACKSAGLAGRSAHGLRKAAATRAAENGATEKELDAIFGWRDGQTSRIYTKNADRAKMAKQAMGKLSRNENETSMLPPSDKVVAAELKPQQKQR